MSLSSDALIFERNQSRERLKLLTAQLDRQASNLIERRSGVTLAEEYAAEDMTFRALDTDIKRLNIYAPHDGLVSELSSQLHIGRFVKKSDPLMRIVSSRSQTLLALPHDIEAARLLKDADFMFISDDASAEVIKGRLTSIAPTSEAIITDKLLTSVTGGRIAVNPDGEGKLLAHVPVFKVKGQADGQTHLSRAQRGIVKIKATPQSPARALWRSIIRVLIRETDF